VSYALLPWMRVDVVLLILLAEHKNEEIILKTLGFKH